MIPFGDDTYPIITFDDNAWMEAEVTFGLLYGRGPEPLEREIGVEGMCAIRFAMDIEFLEVN